MHMVNTHSGSERPLCDWLFMSEARACAQTHHWPLRMLFPSLPTRWCCCASLICWRKVFLIFFMLSPGGLMLHLLLVVDSMRSQLCSNKLENPSKTSKNKSFAGDCLILFYDQCNWELLHPEACFLFFKRCFF